MKLKASLARLARRLMGLVAVVAGPVVAQVPVVIAGVTGCPTCRIDSRFLHELRVPDSEDGLVSPFRFVVDSAGRTYFADPFGTIGIRAFDANGRYLRTVGRRGSGPGEFRRTGALAVGRGDTLNVFHEGVSAFTPTGRFLHTRAVLDGALAQQALALPDGGFAVHASVGTVDAFGHPYHILGADLRIARSFGLPADQPARRGTWTDMRVLGGAANGTFWASRVNEYLLESWSLTGSPQLFIRRDVDWFRPWSAWNSRADIAPPPPRIIALDLDPSGLLWVASLLADVRWRAIDTRAAGPEGRMLTAVEGRGTFDTIIEVIDPATRRVIASRRFDNAFFGMAGGRAMEVLDRNGEVVVGVWQLSLSGR